jgi:site-specific DNA-cytosine methylase
MAAHGYEGQPVLTDSSEFGLPARRRRLYVFLVWVEANPLLSFQDRSVDPSSPHLAAFCLDV